jgi:hypothetical protein
METFSDKKKYPIPTVVIGSVDLTVSAKAGATTETRK